MKAATPIGFVRCALGEQLGDISLRDWFAGQALVGLFSHNGLVGTIGEDWDTAKARQAYKAADAMLAEREAASLAQRSEGE